MMSKRPYVIVAGGLNADLQGRSRSPFRPGDSNPGVASLAAGGVGRNIAENLARLGCRVDLVSVLGDDELSAWLLAGCARLGIGTKLIHILPDTAASQYLCLLDSDGSLVGAVASMDGMEVLTPDILARRASSFQAADLIAADANLPPAALEWLTGTLAGKPLLLDPVSASKAVRALPCVGRFSMVKPNRAEAEVLSGLPCQDEEEAIRAAEALRSRGVEQVFLSLGIRGLLFEGPDFRGIIRPPETRAVNVSGAGDAASAALAWARLKGFDTALAAACAVGAASLTAAVWETVSPEMSPDLLLERAKGARHEAY